MDLQEKLVALIRQLTGFDFTPEELERLLSPKQTNGKAGRKMHDQRYYDSARAYILTFKQWPVCFDRNDIYYWMRQGYTVENNRLSVTLKSSTTTPGRIVPAH